MVYLLIDDCNEMDINYNKTITVKKCNKIKKNTELNTCDFNCKPFVAVSILFLLVSILFSTAFIYFYFNSFNIQYKMKTIKKINIEPYSGNFYSEMVNIFDMLM